MGGRKNEETKKREGKEADEAEEEEEFICNVGSLKRRMVFGLESLLARAHAWHHEHINSH